MKRLLTLLVALFAIPASAEDIAVDIELMLAVDVSYSMGPRELELQRRGYAEALTSPEIMQAIKTGYYQKVAVTYVEWSGDYDQRVIADWALIENEDDLAAFAGTLTARFDDSLRRTSISGVMDYAPIDFRTNGFAGERRVIDISGDGPNNQGRPVVIARDELIADGFVINGLPLMTQGRERDNPFFDLIDLDLYYKACVIGGPLSFVVPVKSWKEFPAAVRRKLVLELAGRVPSPKVVPAAWSGKTDTGYDCLIGEKIWQEFLRRNPGLRGFP
jgi:hypothetical protein